jgi:hypothetical protein
MNISARSDLLPRPFKELAKTSKPAIIDFKIRFPSAFVMTIGSVIGWQPCVISMTASKEPESCGLQNSIGTFHRKLDRSPAPFPLRRMRQLQEQSRSFSHAAQQLVRLAIVGVREQASKEP